MAIQLFFHTFQIPKMKSNPQVKNLLNKRNFNTIFQYFQNLLFPNHDATMYDHDDDGDDDDDDDDDDALSNGI
jgi:hypothetical protein